LKTGVLAETLDFIEINKMLNEKNDKNEGLSVPCIRVDMSKNKKPLRLSERLLFDLTPKKSI